MPQNSCQFNFSEKTFTVITNLCTHLRNVHKLLYNDVHQHAPQLISARNTNECAMGKERVRPDFDSLRTPYQGYNVELQKKELSFERTNAFEEWKANEQKETSAQFCKNRVKRQSNGKEGKVCNKK